MQSMSDLDSIGGAAGGMGPRGPEWLQGKGSDLGSLYSAIWKLAWPAFLGQGIRAVIMFMVRIIVSQLGDKAYNSVNIGMMVFFVIMTLIAAVAVGTTALVALSWGAGDRKRAGEVLQQSLLWGSLLCVFISLIGMPTSRFIYHALGSDAETIKMGTSYLRWLYAATPFLAPGFFLAAALGAAGDTRTPMIGGILMGLLGLGLSYGLILGKFGLPRLGILGAALALDISFFFFTVFLGYLFLTNRTIVKLPLRGWRLDVKTGLAIFRIGIPTALEWTLIQAGMLMYVKVINNYGTQAAAGYFTGVAVFMFAQTPAMGFQVAASTLVGQSVGARRFDRAASAFRHCASMSFGFMALMGLTLYALMNPTTLGHLFHELSPEAIQYAGSYIKLLIWSMPLMGVAFSLGGGLRGAGDTIPPLTASLLGMYGGRILAAFGLYALLHPPVVVIWCSMFPDFILRISVLMARLNSGKWKEGKHFHHKDTKTLS